MSCFVTRSPPSTVRARRSCRWSPSRAATGSAPPPTATAVMTASTARTISARSPATRHRRDSPSAGQSCRTSFSCSAATRACAPRRAAVPRERAEPGVSVGRLLRARDAIKDPLTGRPFPGQHHPVEPVLELREHAAPTVPAPNTPARTTTGRSSRSTTTRIPRRAARPDAQQEPQPVPAVPVLQGQSAEPALFSPPTCRRAGGTSPSATHGSLSSSSSTRRASATTTPTT